MNPFRWVAANAGVYVGNATAKRDFRVQLRGSRSVLLFGLYLGILILVGMFVYNETAGDFQITIVEAQSRLTNFYTVVMTLLGTMIALVAPALTATTVIVEKQRKSLDLVFSAPVSPKYYLVGKMISSYRYTWMLLILSLPVTATCVVLGGASWADVIIAYVLLSLHALLLTSFALMISTIAQKPVSAIVWSYLATGAYLVIISFASAALTFGWMNTREVNFVAAMSPFTVVQAADTYTIILGTEVPNWLIAGLVIVLIAKICLLTAGSILSPFGSTELKSLRIHGLAYVTTLLFYIAYLNSGTATAAMTTPVAPGPGFTTSIAPTVDISVVLGVMLFGYLAWLFIVMPIIACFGVDAEKRFLPNGMYKLRSAFDGTPAGALPYLWMMIGFSTVAMIAGCYLGAGFLPGIPFYAYLVFTAGFWTMFWAIARYTSSLFAGLRSARTLQFAAFLIIIILPVPFLSAIAASRSSYDSSLSSVWEVYILRPLFTNEADRWIQALIYGVIMFVVAFLIAGVAEAKVAKKMAARKSVNEASFAAA